MQRFIITCANIHSIVLSASICSVVQKWQNIGYFRDLVDAIVVREYFSCSWKNVLLIAYFCLSVCLWSALCDKTKANFFFFFLFVLFLHTHIFLLTKPNRINIQVTCTWKPKVRFLLEFSRHIFTEESHKSSHAFVVGPLWM